VRRRRRDFRWLVPLVVLVAAVTVGVLLVRDAQDQDSRPPAPTAPDDRFTLEADDGVLTFDSDGDRTRLEFEGDDQAGTFGFDDAGAADAAGDTGTFELTLVEPFGWPEDFPLPDGALVQRGSVVDAGALRQLSATYVVPTDDTEILAFYQDRLAQARPLVEAGEPVDGAPVTHVSFEGEHSGFLTVTPGPYGTVLGVQLMMEPAPEQAP